ncbi:MAG TPA: L,D-transpeptidase family protein [Allosphingosinicella sp.]|jgi:murein L,D-transpeptidase YcbB/YkuD
MLSSKLLPLFLVAAAAPVLAQQGDPAPSEVGPAPAAKAAPAPAAAAPIRADWKKRDAESLLAFIENIGSEGLDPADYGASRLRQAIGGSDEELDTLATSTFLKVASDLMFGHVRGDDRVDWHIVDDSWNVYDQQALLDRALAGGSMADTLRSLLPTHPQYAQLKGQLPKATDPAMRDKIRANLDRWRWLPRDLGQKYVIVNVPAYTVSLVEGGEVLSRRRAVSGAIKTPTPQLNAVISGAIFNPWWEVPSSIAGEVRGKKGYVSVKTEGGGVRWRQPPGPSNALGKMKLVMPNPHAIYLHDTNAKGLFDRQMRAFSHGCIRTEDAVGFAATLLEGSEWDRAKIDEQLKSGKTVQAKLTAPIPVYIVYFTAAATDKDSVVTYSDLYKRDSKVQVALNDRAKAPNTALASK